MNRNIAKERLPNEPVSMVMEPWWRIGVVNVSAFDAEIYPRLNVLSSVDRERVQGADAGRTGIPAAGFFGRQLAELG